MKVNRRDFLTASGSLAVYFSLPGCGSGDTVVTAGQAMVGNRIRIDAAGSVSLALGKVELGQAIGTALAQIAADELGVDFGRTRLASVDTDRSPDESYTFSSNSIQHSGPAVRQAAASGRQFLLQRAAQMLHVEAGDLRVVDGDILLPDGTTGLDFWQLLAGEHFSVTLSDDGPVLPVTDYRSIGQSVKRLDLPGKLFGEASFLQDLRLPGTVHARVLRPPAERAGLSAFDPLPAAQLAGVLKIVRDGNFVAVIAEREGQARQAAAKLRESIHWDLAGDMPPPEQIYQWLQSAEVRVEPIANLQSTVPVAGNTRTLRSVYERPFQVHGSISPAAAIAQYEAGKLTVWSHAQGMFPLRDAIAHTLGLEPHQVRCIYQQAGGCYGHNGADDAACDAAALALQFPGRPVRLQWERVDEFAWEPYGSAMHIETRADMDEAGQVRRWDFDLWSCPHTSRPRNAEDAGYFIYAQHRAKPLEIPPARSIPQPFGGADRNAVPLYAFDTMKVTKHLVTDMPIRVSALRGLGAYANVFAIESFMDELALAAGQDPLAFRKAHLRDPRALTVLQRLEEVSDWRERPEPGTGHGWGAGFARFKNLATYVGIVFQIKVNNERGEIQLQRAIAVCDAGLIVNPDGVRAQIEGGIIQSASWTLKEQVRFNESQKESLDWARYPILRFDEIPEVQVHLIPQDDQPSLGVGESAQGPTAAAIANALFHASGRRLRRLPLSAEHFFAAEA